MSVTRFSHAWECPTCGHEQKEVQLVTPAGPLDEDPTRVTCRDCAVTSVIDTDWDTHYGLSITVRELVTS